MTRSAICAGVWLCGLLASPRAEQPQIYTWHNENGTLVLSDRPDADTADTFVTAAADTIRTTRAVPPLTDTQRFDQTIERHAARLQIRPDLIRAVIQVESGYDPNARSPKGAMGLMQLMPATAAELGVLDPYDPEQNIRGGVAYLRQLLDRHQGNATLALAAYNAGPGAVARHGNQIPPFPETQAYVEQVQASPGVAAAPHGTETIYKTSDDVKGRRVPVYTNVPPASTDYDIAGQR